MTDRLPIYADPGSPNEVAEFDPAAGDVFPAALLPAASGAAQGALSAADKTKLDGITAGARDNTASNLAPTDNVGVGAFKQKVGADLQFRTPTPGPGLRIEEPAGTSDLLITQEFPQIQPSWSQRDRLQRRATRGNWVAPPGNTLARPTSHGPTGVGPYIEHLYPFTTDTMLDFEGYPHDRTQRLEDSLSEGYDSGLKGYEDGQRIAAFEIARLMGVTFKGVGRILNTTDADTFIEFVLEPNPTVLKTLKSGVNVSTTQSTKKYKLASGTWSEVSVGQQVNFAGFAQASSNGVKTIATNVGDEVTVLEAIGTDEAAVAGVTCQGAQYAGANRMRMLSGQIAILFPTERLFAYEIDLSFHDPKSYSWQGRFEAYGASGNRIWQAPVGGFVDGTGHDFMSADTVLQMRWRIDRIANLNAYDATYQDKSKIGLRILERQVIPRWREGAA